MLKPSTATTQRLLNWTVQDYQEALRDFHWFSRVTGGSDAMIQSVKELLKQSPSRRQFTVLDVGCDSGEHARALVDWGRRRGIRFNVEIRFAEAGLEQQSLWADYPEIRVIGNGQDWQPDKVMDMAYDLIIGAGLLHTESQDGISTTLREMARITRLGYVILDLERNPVAFGVLWLLSRLSGKGRLFRELGPAMVSNSCRLDEAVQMAYQARLGSLRAKRRACCWVVLSGRHSGGIGCPNTSILAPARPQKPTRRKLTVTTPQRAAVPAMATS